MTNTTLVNRVKLHRINVPLLDSYYGISENLAEEEVTDEFAEIIKEGWYWYVASNYDGYGHMIYETRKGEWGHTSLNHCSCHGPLEYFLGNKTFSSLEEVRKNFSEELMEETDKLFAEIKKAQ